MTDPLKIVNLYIETDLHGPRRQDGTVMYLLEAQTSKGTGTRDKIILLRPIFYDLQLPWLIVADLPDIMT